MTIETPGIRRPVRTALFTWVLAAALAAAGMLTAPGGAHSAPGPAGGPPRPAFDLAENDAAYLTELGVIRARLQTGMQLYRAGESEAARRHVRRAAEALDGPMGEALERRGVRDFTAELEELSRRLERNAAPAALERAQKAVAAGFEAAVEAVAEPSPYLMGQVIHGLVRRAADAYGAAVSGQQVTDPAGYQDSMGMGLMANSWLKRLETSGADATVVNVIRLQVDRIEPAWPSLIPPGEITLDPSELRDAAARIEKAGRDFLE